MTVMLEAALDYARRGWPVFPCRPGGKEPLIPKAEGGNGVLDATTDQAQITAWWTRWPTANIGIATGHPGPDVADFDTYGNETAIAAYSKLAAAGLLDGRGAIIKTRSGGLHLYYQGTFQRNGRIPGHHTDFRAAGGYVIAPPSYVEADDKGPAGSYTVLVEGNATGSIDWHICRDYLDPPPAFQPPQREQAALGNHLRAGDDFAAQADWPGILAGWTLARELSDGTRYWRRPGKSGPGISASTRDDGGLWVFTTSTEFEPERLYTKFGAWTLLQGYGTDYTRAAAALRDMGYGEQPETDSAVRTKTGDSDPETHRSHLRFAERLALSYAGQLRHAHGVGWLVWSGTRWQRDNDGAPMRLAISVIRDAVAEAAGRQDKDLASDARRTETAHALSSVLTIASCLKPLAISAAELDPDPWLFNCTNGTLDLRTGDLRAHDPRDLVTRVAGCEYDPAAAGTTFMRFLAEILPDATVRDFVQRLFGYAMLGLVLEHVLAIFTGTGSNGKTTLIEAVKSAFGDYAITAEPDLLIERSHGGHPTGQADLLGARLAITAETEGRLAAATVKRLTGGDRIRARRMRQDFFEFDPSHTVLMVTNHKPRVTGDDPALWRRLRVVPFDVVISKPDSHLSERLRLELPAILAWAYNGYQEYTEHQLREPAAVTERTAAYRASSDALGRFLEESTVEQSFASVRARELYATWSKWCAQAGEEPGSEVQFADSMAGRGFAKKRGALGQAYQGIGLSTDRESP